MGKRRRTHRRTSVADVWHSVSDFTQLKWWRERESTGESDQKTRLSSSLWDLEKCLMYGKLAEVKL